MFERFRKALMPRIVRPLRPGRTRALRHRQSACSPLAHPESSIRTARYNKPAGHNGCLIVLSMIYSFGSTQIHATCRRFGLALALLPFALTTVSAKDVVAFPGAEGFGRLASGGRGGDVYEVTTLDDSGPGSLREGLQTAKGPRTIVFKTSGTIQLKSRLQLTKSDITIAGQTAPGDGICLRDYTFQLKGATNIIIRYLRLRLGDQNKPKGPRGGDDTFNTDDIDRVIVDHCSLCRAIDGTHDLRRSGNFTMQ